MSRVPSAERTLRRQRALEMRLAGASYREIGQALGVSGKTAFHDVTRILADTVQESADRARALEVQRLDRLLLTYWPRALGGDHQATSLVLRIAQRRSQPLGVEARLKVDLTAWVREVAIEEGIDPEQAITDAQAIIRRAQETPA